jgi:nicotinamide riboside kinase
MRVSGQDSNPDLPTYYYLSFANPEKFTDGVNNIGHYTFSQNYTDRLSLMYINYANIIRGRKKMIHEKSKSRDTVPLTAGKKTTTINLHRSILKIQNPAEVRYQT